jgi:hypothetical protein
MTRAQAATSAVRGQALDHHAIARTSCPWRRGYAHKAVCHLRPRLRARSRAHPQIAANAPLEPTKARQHATSRAPSGRRSRSQSAASRHLAAGLLQAREAPAGTARSSARNTPRELQAGVPRSSYHVVCHHPLTVRAIASGVHRAGPVRRKVALLGPNAALLDLPLIHESHF